MKTPLLLPALFLFTAAAALAAEPDFGFTAHEWGTFTSVQAADGVQMNWNPGFSVDLPRFVYERQRVLQKNPGALFAKDMIFARQRMETPVIYFYSDRARTVDVTVKFPKGRVTEWYPQESAADLTVASYPPHQADQWPALHWKDVEILGPSKSEPVLPTESAGSHYYAARETEAAFLRVPAGEKKSEIEKFLFYRGVGDFQAPLIVKLIGDDASQVSLENRGAEKLDGLFLYEVRANGNIVWSPLRDLQPGETRRTALAGGSFGAESLAVALRSVLVQEGLWAKEAAAMVKTWESSWFQERGMRVLYTLPQAWTDRTLPLAITPAPMATARVMVGRAEIITPAMEKALFEEVQRYLAAKPEERLQIVAEMRALGLGRFTEAVMGRLLIRVPRSPEVNSLWSELLQALVKPETKTAAANQGGATGRN